MFCSYKFKLVGLFYGGLVVYAFCVVLIIYYYGTYGTFNYVTRDTTNSTFVTRTDQEKHTEPPVKATESANPTRSYEEFSPRRATGYENVSTLPLFSDDVINPHYYDFTMANSEACLDNAEGPVFLLLLVKCRPNETYDREQIRQTWGGVSKVLDRRTLTMFLVGKPRDQETDKKLKSENDQYGDFIQEDFIDAYENMTIKTIMGLKWVNIYCPWTEYVMSIDSDMMLNIYHLVKRLLKSERSNFAEGHLRIDPMPHRLQTSKWYTPFEIYPEVAYPPFLNGACYVMSVDVAVGIYKESIHVRFLQWDDVFIGLVMTRVGVKPKLSLLYEQFLGPSAAMKRGIGRGIPHNADHVNSKYIKIWKNEVRKRVTGYR